MIDSAKLPNINQNANQRKVDSDDHKYIPKPFKDVAKGMESQFAEYMLQQMRKTVDKNEPESSATKYYNSIIDSEHAKTLTNKDGGLGIQDLILNQIYPKRFRNPVAYRQYEIQQERQREFLRNQHVKMKNDQSQLANSPAQEASNE